MGLIWRKFEKKNDGTSAKAARIFDTISDVGSLLMAGFYLIYVFLLLAFDLGRMWLNCVMLGITILYLGFFVAKIISLNKIFEKKRWMRVARFTLRYSKWAMKLINATFVILTILLTSESDGDALMMIGAIIVIFSFMIAVLWDVVRYVLRQKFSEVWVGWDNLTKEEKNQRIEDIVASFVSGLDTITGADIAASVTRGGGRNSGKALQEGESKKDKSTRKNTAGGVVDVTAPTETKEENKNGQ